MKKKISILVIFVFLLVYYCPKVKAENSSPPSLNDFWEGKANWKFLRKLTLSNTDWPYGFGAGVHIEIVNDIWYLFTRRIIQKNNAYCPFIVWPLTTEVRKSLDKGNTWSQPVTIIPLEEGKPWECAATDGDAYYNSSQNKWYYLFQCLDRNNTWQGCLLEKDGPEPMGIFSQGELVVNPVIPSKSLWNKICNHPTDHCVQLAGGIDKVREEGTFDIFHYDGNFYYVSFHGYDGVRGYRGIAKTNDFINWLAGDSAYGVPEDAVLDLNDAIGWRENWASGGPVGFGAGSILFDGGYYYLISEAADINLACTVGQNWDWGIFRSSSLVSTSWQQFPFGNPFIYSSKYPEKNGQPLPCNPGYGRIFKDPTTSKIYLHFTRESNDPNFSGIYFYELIPSQNLLQNSDLWKCNSENWRMSGSVNLKVYRYPNFSSDGNCYLTAHCKNYSCGSNDSFFQEIDVGKFPQRRFTYGGKFATTEGLGILNLAIWELTEDFQIIKHSDTILNPANFYRLVEEEITLEPQTKIVRFQVYLHSSHTFMADEMFFEPQIHSKPFCDGSGDVNLDGKINNEDLFFIFLNWSPDGPVSFSPSYYCKPDLNNDEKVNEVDLNKILSNWQP